MCKIQFTKGRGFLNCKLISVKRALVSWASAGSHEPLWSRIQTVNPWNRGVNPLPRLKAV